MVAAINFYAGGLPILSSGLAFYGEGFGSSVNVGEYQDTTFISNANGTVDAGQVNNIKYLNPSSGIINTATDGVALTQIPNNLATLNIRFTNDTPVTVQNCRVRVYDRVNINSVASGVLTQLAEVIHPDITQTNNGSGDSSWHAMTTASGYLQLANSPGISGLFAGNGSNSVYQSNRHDHYICITQSPSSVGSKLSALYFSCEYV